MTSLLTDPVRYWARQDPGHEAIVFDGDDRLAYGDLDRWTDGVAHLLVGEGVARGDRVGILGGNSLEWCAAAVGALKAGAIVSPYNPRLTVDELSYMVGNSAPTVLFASAEHRGVAAAVTAGDHTLLDLDVVADLRGRDHPSFARLDLDPEDVAVIVYTSGTTAHPKGVTFTHRSILGTIAEWGFMEPTLGRDTRTLLVLSLAGCPGIIFSLLPMLTHGGTLVLEARFDPVTALDRLATEAIHWYSGVPFIFEQLATLPEFLESDLSALHIATVGGARVTDATLQAWHAKGIALRQLYGMTELGGTSIVNSREMAMVRPDSVGTGSIFTEHRTMRPDGTFCEPGEPGEIVARGPGVTPGYWRNPEATAEAKRDGWFHSGDLGVIDEDGHLVMIDRLKDIVISGGFNIAPSEVEAVLLQMPGVEEVAVIPADDARFGEVPAAVVRAGGGFAADAVEAHCRGLLAGYKVPRHVIVLDEPLPRMPSGKIARKVLRARYGATASGAAAGSET